MNTQNTREWASVGIGALISGALVVVVSQAAIVRREAASTPAEAVADEAAPVEAGAVALAPGERPRLQLPRKEQSVEEPRATARRVERVEPKAGKVALGTKERVAGAVQRLADARAVDKATQAEASPELTAAVAAAEPVTPPMTSIHPQFRTQSTTVNAGFDAPDARTTGEDLSWEVHETFQSDGPRPFFYVDENTGTLMFGLGWQH